MNPVANEETYFIKNRDIAKKLDSVQVLSAGAVASEGKPVPTLERYSVAGEPLMFEDHRTGKIHLNARFFSDFRRVDVTIKLPGKTRIGTWKELTFREISPRRVIAFLLESQVIQTFVHLEATLKTVEEKDLEGILLVHFQGEHIYYTNKKHVKPLDFSVSLNKKTGEILVSDE